LPCVRSKKKYEPRRQIRANKIPISQEEGDRLIELVSRAYTAKKPAKEDLNEIRKLLIDHPEFCKAIFGTVEVVQTEIIKNMLGGEQEVPTIALEEYNLSMRDEMGYHGAPIMEKLLIENIVTCCLRMQHYEQQLAFRMKGSYSLTILEFWERRLTTAQRRYLAASESLAKIRKMALQALQLNIGDKQINVAGNLQRNSKGNMHKE
jgi:hypothetical protein